MGIESRDYARGSSGWSSGYGGFGGTGGFAPVVKWLIIANIAVFLLQVFITRPMVPADVGLTAEQTGWEQHPRFRVSPVERWLILDGDAVLQRGQVWRLVTYSFLHSRGQLFHILFNMLFVFWFGRTLESMYGSREFLLFYLVAAVVSAVAYLGLNLVVGRMNPALGASGAVMAVVMLYAIHYPRQQILLFLVLPVEIRWVVAAYVVFDMYPVLVELGGGQTGTGIAHAAHLGGLAFGFAYWKLNWRIERLGRGWRLPRFDRWFGSRRRIRLHRPDEPSREERPAAREPSESRESREALSARVDAILEKISRHGEASLTDEERETLKKASRIYRRQ